MIINTLFEGSRSSAGGAIYYIGLKGGQVEIKQCNFTDIIVYIVNNDKGSGGLAVLDYSLTTSSNYLSFQDNKVYKVFAEAIGGLISLTTGPKNI